jgi:hypothetical protein
MTSGVLRKSDVAVAVGRNARSMIVFEQALRTSLVVPTQ